MPQCPFHYPCRCHCYCNCSCHCPCPLLPVAPHALVSFNDRLFAFRQHTVAWVGPLTHSTTPTLILLGVATALSSLAVPALLEVPTGARTTVARTLAVLRVLLSHAGTALVLAWLFYVYVFHTLANLPVRGCRHPWIACHCNL